MVPIVRIGAGRLRLFFLVRVGGTDTSNTRSALHSKPRQQNFPETGTLRVLVSVGVPARVLLANIDAHFSSKLLPRHSNIRG